MNSETAVLLDSIPIWVAATEGITLPTPLAPEELGRRVREVRTMLRERSGEAIDIPPDDEGLAILSRLCFELSNETMECDTVIFSEASNAYAVVSRIPWPPDEFGERNETLADVALAAWRSARQVLDARAVQEWERKYQEALAGSSALRSCLDWYLGASPKERSDELKSSFFGDIRTLFAVLSVLRICRNTDPLRVVDLASDLYQWIKRSRPGRGDEFYYLIAEACLLTGSCYRFLGYMNRVEYWLGKAEAFFRRTRRPEAGLARSRFNRLALDNQAHRYEQVLSAVPDLRKEFERLGMLDEAAYSTYLLASAQELSGKKEEAARELLALYTSLVESGNGSFLGPVAIKLGTVLAARGAYREASEYFGEALARLGEGPGWATATLRLDVGTVFRDMSDLDSAAIAFREAIGEYAGLGFLPYVAYARILLAETLLLAGRASEAEVEIRAALPTIDEQGMVREAVAALSILRESVRRCNIDGEALRKVREHMRGAMR